VIKNEKVAVKTQRGSEPVTMDRPVNDCTVVYDADAGAASSSHMESVDHIPTVDYGDYIILWYIIVSEVRLAAAIVDVNLSLINVNNFDR